MYVIKQANALGTHDAGVIAERAKLKESVDSPIYKGLYEGQLRKILYFALLQQQKKHLAGTHDLENSPMAIGFVAMQLYGVVNGCFMRVLRFSGRMGLEQPITVYGTDSLPLSRSIAGLGPRQGSWRQL
ncbi:hypothetical protein F4803DRAFT_545606 [Xylaria telfairii]|nr:hypothetical protein F4803DRAFT_545606 [Xylaria telfairii]